MEYFNFFWNKISSIRFPHSHTLPGGSHTLTVTPENTSIPLGTQTSKTCGNENVNKTKKSCPDNAGGRSWCWWPSIMNETEKQFHFNHAQKLVCHQHNSGIFYVIIPQFVIFFCPGPGCVCLILANNVGRPPSSGPRYLLRNLCNKPCPNFGLQNIKI